MPPPELIAWETLLALVQQDQPLRIDRYAHVLLHTEGWLAQAPVRLGLRMQTFNFSIDLHSDTQGCLDFNFLPGLLERQVGTYILEMEDLAPVDAFKKKAGPSAQAQKLALRVQVQDKKLPGVVRVDWNTLLVHDFAPGQAFRLNIYECIDPSQPEAGGNFFGSAEFGMPPSGPRVIQLEFLQPGDEHRFAFVVEGCAMVPVIAGLEGQDSLGFFQPEDEQGCGCPENDEGA